MGMMVIPSHRSGGGGGGSPSAGDAGIDPTGSGSSGRGGDPPGPRLGTVRVRVFVEGRVQGVWFRESTRQAANRLEINGWVRNLPDGRVEAAYEGSREAVEEMITWTRRGPERALVTDVQIHEEEPKGERGFSVH